MFSSAAADYCKTTVCSGVNRRRWHPYAITRWFWCGLFFAVAVTLAGCSERSSGELSPAELLRLGELAPELPSAERRVGIVFSEHSANQYYDGFVYRQLFAAMQNQSMQAGLPYSLLNAADLTDADALAAYDVLLIPYMPNVHQSQRTAIEQALLAAQQAGVAIITSGEFMIANHNGNSFNDTYRSMEAVLGVAPESYLSAVPATVRVSDNGHPITSSYTVNDQLVSYDQIWFANFSTTGDDGSQTLLQVSTPEGVFDALRVIDRPAPVIHFANEEIMADHNLLWRVLQWAAHDAPAPASLQISRSDSVFLARNDMDQAMQRDELDQTEIPLLDFIRDWKERFDFVGSYYIDIGNDPIRGQFTDWSVSGPLYTEYIALGNEIGTHSWTHPHFTANLNATELEFEFNQSRLEISNRLGVDVTGGAVPGNPESLAVVDELRKWFEYFSGRSGTIEASFQTAIGFLQPDHDMMYFSLNLSPDFTLIDVDGRTPEAAEGIWRTEIDALTFQSRMPVLHWLWHDYGPTQETVLGNYSVEMFENTIAYAEEIGTEFVTLDEMQKRLRVFSNSTLTTGSDGRVLASVAPADGTGVGQMALALENNLQIRSVDNWYAYNDTRVFLPDSGGDFVIRPGTEPAAVTRIVDLPMRAQLQSVSGTGDELSFTFSGAGEVSVRLSERMTNNVRVNGADAFTENGDLLTLTFANDGPHTVELTPIRPLNTAPSADAVQLTTALEQALPITLTATDPDDDSLTYRITLRPQHGTLSGDAPELVYTPNEGFTGTDDFGFIANDGSLDSAEAIVDITVAPRSLNSPPQANSAVLETLQNTEITLQLSGSDNEGQSLSYRIVTGPANGSLDGTAPTLRYLPNTGFTGTDSVEFSVNDGEFDSAVATVTINVVEQSTPSNGSLSNPLDVSPVIDGLLSEWGDTTSFGTDPDDIDGPNNLIDWAEVGMAHDDTHLYLSMVLHDEAQLSWGNQVYLDIDTDATTGFSGFSSEYLIGADFLLESGTLQRYTGNDNNSWSWETIAQVDAVAAGNVLEVRVARTLLDDPDNIWLVLLGNSTATGGAAVDLFPDQAADPFSLERQRRFSYTLNSVVSPDNRAPFAFAQTLNTTRTAELPIRLGGADEDGDALTYTITRQPQSGSLSGTAPELVYRPDDNFNGNDVFAFVVNDGELDSNPAEITVNVTEPLPSEGLVALAQQVSVSNDASRSITLTATAPDGIELGFELLEQPANGVLSGVAPDLVYTPDEGYVGGDSFTFVVSAGEVTSAPATVQIEVVDGNPANTAPAANAQSLSTAFETSVGITLSGSDADDDALSYRVVSIPQLGTLTGVAPDLTYTPFSQASGTDSFRFVVNDGTEDSSEAVVTVMVLAPVQPNRSPRANGQSYETSIDTEVLVRLGGSDPDGDALVFTVANSPPNGSLTGTAPDLIYQPNQGFSGTDTFTFTVSDGSLTSAAAVISVAVGDVPVFRVSNPVDTAITVDGDITDWGGLDAFVADADDINGPSNPLDWRQLWMAHDASTLYIAYRNDGPFSLSWGSALYLDTDDDTGTGFRGFDGNNAIGAELLIESGFVYQYAGNGTSWSWNFAAAATIALTGDTVETAIPRSVLSGSSSLNLFLRADNAAFGGTAVDYYPDAAIDPTMPSEQRALVYDLF